MIHKTYHKTLFGVFFSFLSIFCLPGLALAEIPDPEKDLQFKKVLDEALAQNSYVFTYESGGKVQKFYFDIGLGFDTAKAVRPGEIFSNFLKEKTVYRAKPRSVDTASNQTEFVTYVRLLGTEILLEPPLFSFYVTELNTDQDSLESKTNPSPDEMRKITIEVIRLMNNLKKQFEPQMLEMQSLAQVIENIDGSEENRQKFIHDQCKGVVAVYRKRIAMVRALHGKLANEVLTGMNTSHKLSFIREKIHPSMRETSDEVFLKILADKKL